MITIGITGGYATGKTVVADMFAGQGVEVVCTDRIAYMAIQPYTSAWKKVVDFFGKDILKEDDQINRRKLAKIVFADKKKLEKLNRFVHPLVKAELKRIIKDKKTKAKTEILAIEIPLLFEAGMEDWFDKIVVVTCKKDVQYKMADRRDNIPKEELLQRINSQWPLSRKKKMADFVIDNSGTMEETKRQVIKVCDELKREER